MEIGEWVTLVLARKERIKCVEPLCIPCEYNAPQLLAEGVYRAMMARCCSLNLRNVDSVQFCNHCPLYKHTGIEAFFILRVQLLRLIPNLLKQMKVTVSLWTRAWHWTISTNILGPRSSNQLHPITIQSQGWEPACMWDTQPEQMEWTRQTVSQELAKAWGWPSASSTHSSESALNYFSSH